MTTSSAKAAPPNTGSTQLGRPFLVSASIFTVKTPKRCSRRSSAGSPGCRRSRIRGRPAVYATGTVTMNASLPDQRCRVPIHGGEVIQDTFPYMTRAEPTSMTAQITASVAGPAFTGARAREPDDVDRYPGRGVQPPVDAERQRHQAADERRG